MRCVCPNAITRVTDQAYLLEFSVDVDFYEPRRIRLGFAHGDEPIVFADGPKDSPHRYANDALCMWHPDDPATKRWIPAYGAQFLVEMIRTHLFREAWWRETDEWPGEEAPHDTPARTRRTR